MLPLDRDASQASHTAKLIEFVCSWCARFINVYVQRTDHTAGGTIDQEGPRGRDVIFRSRLSIAEPGNVFGDTGRDAILRMMNGRSASQTVRVHLHEIQAQFEFVVEARCFSDPQCLAFLVEHHDRASKISAQLLDEATNRA